jgi:hypothetical protein
MGFVGLPPPQSETIDFASLVAALDPGWKDPQVVYEFPNGRKFKEFPAADQRVFSSENGGALYVPSGSVPGTLFYAVE